MCEVKEVVADAAYIDGVVVLCPVCEEPHKFPFEVLEEDSSGKAWSVADPVRFDVCGECDTLIDFGAMQFSLELHNKE